MRCPNEPGDADLPSCDRDRPRDAAYEVARGRFLSRPMRAINETGAPYPNRDDLHDRVARPKEAG
jgi:hypothetical protein